MNPQKKRILMKRAFDYWRGMLEYEGDDVKGWYLTNK